MAVVVVLVKMRGDEAEEGVVAGQRTLAEQAALLGRRIGLLPATPRNDETALLENKTDAIGDLNGG